MRDLEGSLAAVDQQDAEGCVKIAADLARYRTVLTAVDPAVVVECGTFSGKSASWFAEVGDCDVITVDVADRVPDEVRAGTRGVTWLLGDSVAMAATVAPMVRGRSPVMVVLDSDHSAAHVLAEMEAYGPLVTVGSYMVVEDGLVRYMQERNMPVAYPYEGSPLDAIEAFMLEHVEEWTIDQEIEEMFAITQHPCGFLRRL